MGHLNMTDHSFQLTVKAQQAILEAVAHETDMVYLRVGVKGSGCNGYKYVFQWDTEEKDDDLVFQQEGAVVVIDPKSIQFLNGATLDYHKSLMKSEFRIINNANAKSDCGCGKVSPLNNPLI